MTVRYYLQIICSLSIVILCHVNVYANYEQKGSVGGEPLQDVFVISRKDWLIVPYVNYKPETQLAGGAIFLTYFQDIVMNIPPIKLRPTTLQVSVTQTQNGQFMFQVLPEFYFYRDRFHIKNDFQYMDYYDKFYGIGQDTSDKHNEYYRSRVFAFKNVAEYALVPKLYMGLIYHIDVRETTKAESGGLIDANLLPGAKEGLVSGLGFTVNYDNRDDIIYTRSGSYANLSVIQYSEYIKSDFNYTNITFDFRYFEPFLFSHILAFQFYTGYIDGEAPFYLLSMLGGDKLMRGLYQGRYRDNDVMVAQVEYRVPLFWRFIACGFAGAGEVAPGMDDFKVDEIVYAWGGGLRFKLRANQDLNVRMDVGFSKNFIGIYATVGEAI